MFLSLGRRLELLSGTGIETVPVIHRGPLGKDRLESSSAESAFGASFGNPLNGGTDSRMEGLYLHTSPATS